MGQLGDPWVRHPSASWVGFLESVMHLVGPESLYCPLRVLSLRLPLPPSPAAPDSVRCRGRERNVPLWQHPTRREAKF